MKSKKELREIAKSVLARAVSNASYQIVDEPDRFDLTEEEVNAVVEYIDAYGTTMCKSIRKEYI